MFYCYRTNGEKLFPSRTSIPRLHYTVTALQFEEYKPQRRRPDDDDQGGGWGRPKTAQRTFINFTSAKQRHLTTQVASKARQRGVQLAQIIELDVAKYVTGRQQTLDGNGSAYILRFVDLECVASFPVYI